MQGVGEGGRLAVHRNTGTHQNTPVGYWNTLKKVFFFFFFLLNRLFFIGGRRGIYVGNRDSSPTRFLETIP